MTDRQTAIPLPPAPSTAEALGLPAPFRKKRKRTPVAVDLSDAELDALERVRAALSSKLGEDVPRMAALRIVVGAGLERLAATLSAPEEAPPCAV